MTDPIESDSDFIAEALPIFIGEAQEQIESIEQLLLRLEDEPGNHDLLDALFRCAHTVKGSAGIFGLDRVVAFTHHVESLLDRLREGQIAFTPDLGTLLLRCNDEIRALVSGAGHPGEDDARAAERQALIVQLQAAGGADRSAPAAAPTTHTTPTAGPAAATEGAWHVSVAFSADTFRNGMDPLAILGYLDKLGTVSGVQADLPAVPRLEELDPETCHQRLALWLQGPASREQIEAAFSFVRDDCELLIEPPAARAAAVAVDAPAGHAPAPAAAAPRAPSPAAAAPTFEDQRFIRVHADRLDAVISLLGELVIASAGASMLAQQTRQRALSKANHQVGRLIEEIRNSTLQLRMVPIGETFSRFRRVVRDTAAELGKDVVLELQGGETELDKSVVERIADPLMHLVRNALDHGLERPEDRVAAGKPAQGRLVLSACHEAGNILIRIRDDGRGIRRDKVLQRAHERGLVPRDVVPSDAEILKLIFEPGFSTAEQVTNLSGRGVGMDVVRRNIESLRGSIEITSDPGQGCCIEIRLPLTLAIIDGFLVGVGSSKFIFPLDTVVEVVESRPTTTQLDARGRCVIELRGQVLPVVSLRGLYALDGEAPERSSVVVLQAAGQRYGVVVDQLLGQHQTVIKPLGRLFRSLRGMSGSSILGNGEVALIFDAVSLCHLAAAPPGARRRHATDSASPSSTPSKPEPVSSEGQTS